MNILEILKEEYIDRRVGISNFSDFSDSRYEETYIIGKNHNGRIGIFYEDVPGLYNLEEIESSDIPLMRFEFIEL